MAQQVKKKIIATLESKDKEVADKQSLPGAKHPEAEEIPELKEVVEGEETEPPKKKRVVRRAKKVKVVVKSFADTIQETIKAVKQEAKSLPYHSNSVDYNLLDAAGKIQHKVFSAACFAQLLGTIHNNSRAEGKQKKDFTFLHFKLKSPKLEDKELEKKFLEYLEHGKELGLIASEQTAEEIFKEGLKLNLLDESLTILKLYASLCYVRDIQECPSTPVVARALLGMGVNQKFAYLHSTLNSGRWGHALVPDYNSCVRGDELSTYLCFKHYLMGETKDSRLLKDVVSGKLGHVAWKFSDTVYKENPSYGGPLKAAKKDPYSYYNAKRKFPWRTKRTEDYLGDEFSEILSCPIEEENKLIEKLKKEKKIYESEAKENYYYSY